MPTELFTQLFIFLTAFLGFARYIIGVWFKLKEKDKKLEHSLMLKTIDRLDMSVKEIKGEFTEMRGNMNIFRNELATLVKTQIQKQREFDSFISKMDTFMTTANQRFEKLENYGKVQVKD